MKIIFSLFDRVYLFWFYWFRVWKGYSIVTASSESEKQQCREFVWKVFDEARFFTDFEIAKKIPDEGCDEEVAIVKHGGKVVGVLEIVQSKNRFPLEYFFNVQIPVEYPREQLVELTRFAISKQHRKQQAVVSLLLLLHALKFCRRKSIRYWLGCSPSILMHGFRPFFGDWKTLVPQAPEEFHLSYRRGRENYFDAKYNLVVYLIDSHQVAIYRAGNEFLRRMLKRLRKKLVSRRRRK